MWALLLPDNRNKNTLIIFHRIDYIKSCNFKLKVKECLRTTDLNE